MSVSLPVDAWHPEQPFTFH